MQQLAGLDASFLAGRELPAAEPFQPERPPPLPVLAARTVPRLAWRPVQIVQITNELVRILPTLAPPLSTLVSSRELIPDIDKLASYLPEELALLAGAVQKRAAGQTGP